MLPHLTDSLKTCPNPSVSLLMRWHVIHHAGTFSPGIEIWDLDVLDSVEPLATLGGPLADSEAAQPTKEEMAAAKKKKKKKKASKVRRCMPFTTSANWKSLYGGFDLSRCGALPLPEHGRVNCVHSARSLKSC